MDSASELADGVADLADGELADGVATKHGTVVHGLRLPRTTRFTKKMQLSATLGYIHCAAKDVIACVPVWPTSYPPLPGARRAAALSACPLHTREKLPVKRHRGTPGQNTGHTGARGHTDHTDEPHNQAPKPNDTPARPRDGRLGRPKPRPSHNSRKNSRRPGVDRSPRPTQKRPPPANPTLPPPAPRAPPRACSKAVGEMIKARTADA